MSRLEDRVRWKDEGGQCVDLPTIRGRTGLLKKDLYPSPEKKRIMWTVTTHGRP